MGERTQIDIPLRGGLKQKTSEPWLDPSSMPTATNAIWVVENGLDKRPGYLSGNTGKTIAYPQATTYPFTWGASSLSAGIGLLPSQNGLAISDGFYLYGQNAAQGVNDWVDMVPPCVATRRTVGAGIDSAYNPTVGSWNGQSIYVWQSATTFQGWGDGLLYAIVNDATGETIRKGIVQPLATGRAPRIAIMGSVAFVFYETSAATLEYSSLDLSNPASTWSTTVGFIASYTGGGFDISSVGFSSGGANYILLAFADANAAQLYFLKQATSTTTAVTINTSPAFAAPRNVTAVAIRWDPTNTRAWLALAYTTAGGANTIAGQLLTVTFGGATFTATAVYALTSISVYASGSHGGFIRQLAVEDASAGSPLAVVAWGVGIVAGTGTSTQDSNVGWGSLTGAGAGAFQGPLAWNVGMASKLFSVTLPGGQHRVYGWVATVSVTGQTTQTLVEFDPTGYAVVPHPVATIAPRLVIPGLGGTADLRGPLSLSDVVSNSSTRQYRFAGVISQTNDPPPNQSVISGLADFAHPGRSQSVRLGSLCYVAGGIPSQFDGINCPESSTLVGTSAALASSGAAGSMTTGQKYTYRWVPECRDTLGNVCQGQPGPAVQVTLGGGNTSVSGAVLTMSLTSKGVLNRVNNQAQGLMYLVPYRTAYTGGAMSTDLYRIPGDDPGSAYANQPTTTGRTIAFADGLSDALLVLNPLIPTTGGILEADCPSSFAAIAEHNSRVYGVGDDLRTVWISTVVADGVPCTFNDGSQVEVSFLGDLTALWSQDQNLIYASANGLAYSQGGGVNLTGVQSDLTPPVQIPSDVGCVDPRAWCTTPQGTVFRTQQGLALLDRALTVHSDFGDPVIALLAAYPTVTAMQQHPTRPELLIFCTDGTKGIVLVYNARYNAWSDWPITDPDFNDGSLTTAATVVQGNVYLLNAAGRLFREKVPGVDARAFYDTSNATDTWVQLVGTTGWVKTAGKLQGLGWIHGIEVAMLNQDWSAFAIGVQYDYNTGVTSSVPWTSAKVSAFPDVNGVLGTMTEVGFKPPYARATAFRVIFTDGAGTSPNSVTGQGMRIVSVSCEVEPFAALRRLPGAQKG